MTYVYTNAGRRYHFRALTLLAVLLGACDADRLTTSPDSPLAISTDSAGLTDSTAAADSSALADSLEVSDSLAPVDSLLMSAAATRRGGVPFGPHGLWASYKQMNKGYELFNASVNSDSPSGLITRINAARQAKQHLFLVMAGGAHSRYITRGKFDLAKWKRRMDAYRTPAIKAAIRAAVADGTVLGDDIIDEPNHPTWGGVMTKALLDRMAAYVKGIFPTLPVGVSIRWDWRSQERYKVVDFITTQYVTRFGSVDAWRNGAIEAAKKNRIALVLAFNPLNGGTVTRGCPLGRTGGKGTYGGNCRMTPAQIRSSGMALGTGACAVVMWKYDRNFMLKTANAKAFRDVKNKLANSPGRSCRRY
jgi:hypothetical protein